MNPWIRLYRESLHNPKIVSLNDRQHRAWHNLLLVANDVGALPAMRDIACHLRMTIQEAEAVCAELVELGLVDVDCINPSNRKLAMHDWCAHQYVSDSSTSRVQKFRKKIKDENAETPMKRFSNGDVAPSESESDTESDNNYVLSGGRARRNEQGFDSGFGGKGTKGKASHGWETLLKRAEGFGLSVDELTEATTRKNVRNRTAYFTTLAVNRLQAQLPSVNPGVLRDALWGKDGAAGIVYAALTNLEGVA